LSVEALAAGRYRIERVLGHGGMAAVYLARDGELERPVAVKLLAENLAGDESFRDRFVREARLAARLSHPNVVQVFDAGEDGNRPFIVMEYVEGETLADVLGRRGRLPAHETVDLALQVCGGLEHAHEHGLVHRDVKPGNLLVRSDGMLKIADFGIARAAEATKLTQIGTVLGTAAYLAPEQLAGEDVGQRADLYSLGAVLYEMLTGRTPYEVASLPELALQQREGTITPVRELEPTVGQAVEDVVMRCLARNPDYRPASAAEVARELASASPEAPTEPLAQPERVAPAASAVPQPPPTTLIRARREWLWVGIAAVVVLAVLAIALAVASGGSKAKRTPARVDTPARGTTAAEEARNLRDWLRRYSR
jgi:serine/threonine-protein kinase